jgi:acetyltransferase-like isoleucine patch superfamily enzyme
MKALQLAMGLLPSVLHVAARRLLGAKIGPGARLGLGTFLVCDELELEAGASLGPATWVRAERVHVGRDGAIRPLSVIVTHTLRLGRAARIAPLAIVRGQHDYEPSVLELGDHSRIFPFCWLEPGEGIHIGRHVGIGGHALIFTHGVWADYLRSGPLSFGPVRIEDNVWLPWRVFVLPNVTIGESSIIGAGSVVNRSIPPSSLAAGIPAKVVREGLPTELDAEERERRALEILSAYADYCRHRGHRRELTLVGKRLTGAHELALDEATDLERGDIVFFVSTTPSSAVVVELVRRGVSVVSHPHGTAAIADGSPLAKDFVEFLRRFGIRLSVEDGTDGAPSAA